MQVVDANEGVTRTPTMEDWTKGFEALSGLYRASSPWIADDRLFRFFRLVAKAGPNASLADLICFLPSCE